ncbi:MAG: hypothetical protein DRH24_09785 [Deltaproteobacteria bacterium]|nr:MAG: hypothetical protein DRH24_09785 [Deltaproteobacteria bacterium]
MKSVNGLGFYRFLFGIFCVMILSLIGPGLSFAQEPGQSEKAAISQEMQNVTSEQGWKVLATSPGVKVLSQEFNHPGKVLPSGENPLDVAQNWLADKGFEEGRNLFKDKLLYLSIGSAAVNATPSDPGYIDSRFLAVQRAELDAKVKTAIFMGVDLTTIRGSSEREINPKERAELENIVNTSPTLKKNSKAMGVFDTMSGLFEKVKILAEAKLDKAIKDAGVDTSKDQEEIKQKKAAKKEKRNRLRNISEASMKAAASAFADVQGTQIIQSFEGSYHNNYQVIVITLWSHNMQRMVDSMQRGIAPIGLPYKQAKQEVSKQLPKDVSELACLTGVRAYINNEGQHVLLSFGQAGVEPLGGRMDKAFERAGKKARLRAMAAMRTFMGEKLAFSATEELLEVLALYASEYQEDTGAQDYKSISQFQENIRAVSKKQKITGLHGLMTKELTHPFTDKPMVLKVMSWSPSSQAMAQELKQAIEHKPESTEPAKTPAVKKKVESPARKGVISSGQGADKDAW